MLHEDHASDFVKIVSCLLIVLFSVIDIVWKMAEKTIEKIRRKGDRK